MINLGDFTEDSTVRVVLSTNNTSGAAVAPSSAFEADDFRIYKNGSATQKATTNGITVASPFDSVTGLHTLEIDTSNDTGDSGFWTTGADYWIIAVPDETVDSQTVIAPIAVFSIQNRYSSARLAAIEADTVDIQSRLPASLDSGNMRSSVQSMAANTLTASALAADAVTELQSGLSTLDASGVRTSLGMAAADMDTQLDAILAASGGSGVVVGPLVQTDSQRNTPAYIECNQYDQSTLGPFRVETASGGQFNFATQTDWIVVVWDKDDNQLGVVAYGDIDFTSSTNNAVMDQYSFAPSAGQVATAGRHTFAIRRPQGTTEQAPVGGVFNVIRCPRGPAV